LHHFASKKSSILKQPAQQKASPDECFQHRRKFLSANSSNLIFFGNKSPVSCFALPALFSPYFKSFSPLSAITG